MSVWVVVLALVLPVLLVDGGREILVVALLTALLVAIARCDALVVRREWELLVELGWMNLRLVA